MAKQRGLGKGLSSLIPSTEEFSQAPAKTDEPRETFDATTLPIDSIHPNPDQPRKSIDDAQLSALSESIAEHGIIQPILVKADGDGYQIIAGERRWRAAKQAGLQEVPIRILDVSEEQAMELALVENLQREDLSPLEVALAIQEMITKLDITHEEVAGKIGMSRAAVTNKLRLLQLPKDILDMLDAQDLTEGHARALLSLQDHGKMLEFADIAVERNLSVRQLEEMIRQAEMRERIGSALPRRAPEPQEFQDEIDRIGRTLNLSVKVAGNRKNMGLLIKGLKKWQVQMILEYIENNRDELFPRE